MVLHLIGHPDETVFEAELNKLISYISDPSFDSVGYILERCRELERSIAIPPREQNRRTRLLIQVSRLGGRKLAIFASQAAGFDGAVRNAILALLPPDLKPLLFGNRQAIGAGDDSKQSLRSAVSAEIKDISTHSRWPGCQILLVGTKHEHDRNFRFCEDEQHRVDYVRVSNPNQIQDFLQPHVFAIVVGASCWSGLSHSEQLAFTDRICSFSSFAWIRVDTTGITEHKTFESRCAKARFRARSHVLTAPSCTILETDVPLLDEAAVALREVQNGHFHPADIDPQLGSLLRASAVAKVKERNIMHVVEPGSIGIRALSGGRSGAKLYQLLPHDHGYSFVAKIDQLDLLQDEMTRFDKCIRPYDSSLQPELHFHHGKGTILFGLVPGANDQALAAPTLEQKLAEFDQSELGGSTPDINECDLERLVSSVVKKLKLLNGRAWDTSSNLSSKAWIDIGPLLRMRENGIRWDIPSAGGRSLIELAQNEIASIAGRRTLATIHGDIHLRNVLVRDREPYLIDYACCGPGHPFFDLARFELALAFKCVRPITSEETLANVFELLNDFEVDADSPNVPSDFRGSVLNRIAMLGTINCRAACAQLATKYSIPFRDYYVLKLAIACQSLANTEFQTSVVRAMLSACIKSLSKSTCVQESATTA